MGDTLSIHGTGLATRSYMHVDDAASAFDIILHHGEASNIYNIGAHEERTVLSVARDICKILGRDSSTAIAHVRDRTFNDRRYFIDCTKLQALGWSQKTNWEEGLRETVQWYVKQDLNSYWNDFSSALQAHPLGLRVNKSFSQPNALAFNLTREFSDGTAQEITFLIYGRTGWIGGMLGHLLEQGNHKYFYGSARLHDRRAIEEDIARCRPTHILNAAGITGRPNVDWCESHKREVVQTNVLGTLNLIDLAHSKGIHVTNFATGCIFSYDDEHPIAGAGFTETDAPNFRGSYYSKTKAMVDELVQQYDNVLHLIESSRSRAQVCCAIKIESLN